MRELFGVVFGAAVYAVIALMVWKVIETRREVRALRAAVDEIRARLDAGRP